MAVEGELQIFSVSLLSVFFLFFSFLLLKANATMTNTNTRQKESNDLSRLKSEGIRRKRASDRHPTHGRVIVFLAREQEVEHMFWIHSAPSSSFFEISLDVMTVNKQHNV